MTGIVVEYVVYLLTLPLRVLYFHGPRLGGYGFQEGVAFGSACEKVTSVRSEFWSGSGGAVEECLEILERKFNAFVVGGCAVFAVAVLYQYIHVLSTRHVIYPAIKSVDAKVDGVIKFIDELENNKQVAIKSIS